jgi:hypothetical protein
MKSAGVREFRDHATTYLSGTDVVAVSISDVEARFRFVEHRADSAHSLNQRGAPGLPAG